ncbi:ATP-binding protein [Streptomyces flavochromogenes]|jgi:two-component sensor histidine kinase|uniref:ATP-binding protein n=1 Tax=Streptomyces flavochromogenes TaxID=68199 RepID=A0ABW6XR52_9ACTN|nr:ATP-binding protein [Streptomyces flavochromogenes]
MDRFRPWRKYLPPVAVEHALPRVQRHIVSVHVGPGAVRVATRTVSESLTEAGIAPTTAFADAVLLVVGELVTNVVRHAANTPVAYVGITVAGGQLAVSVADDDDRLPCLDAAGMGPGLWMVSELADEYQGQVLAEPAADRGGKTVMARFQIPS